MTGVIVEGQFCGLQAAQNAEARRSLETRDMEHAEVLHSLQELQASLQVLPFAGPGYPVST